MNKQPFYHDMRIIFTQNIVLSAEQCDRIESDIRSLIIESMNRHSDAELIDDSVDVFIDDRPKEEQILFTTTSGFEPPTLSSKIQQALMTMTSITSRDKIEVLSCEVEAGDPCDLM